LERPCPCHLLVATKANEDWVTQRTGGQLLLELDFDRAVDQATTLALTVRDALGVLLDRLPVFPALLSREPGANLHFNFAVEHDQTSQLSRELTRSLERTDDRQVQGFLSLDLEPRGRALLGVVRVGVFDDHAFHALV